jgi:predicted ATPase
MKIERLEIKNYRVFRDVELAGPSELAIVVGANGTGKSTLFDVFGFLRDALQDNVHAALAKRGGFHEVRSREQEGPIAFELVFRADASEPRATYVLEIGEHDGRSVVLRESLSLHSAPPATPLRILEFKLGEGKARTADPSDAADDASTWGSHELDSPDILAIKGLGQFRRVSVISQLRRLIEGWHLSDLHVPAARPSQEAGYAEHLSPEGDNLPLVTRHLYENHRDLFAALLEHMKRRVPGVSRVEATETADKRVVLRFQDGAFKDPFLARYVSDGTIAMFAYLVLLHDPAPHPLLCIEEPEHHLYRTLMPELLEEFRDYGRRGGQVMVSTHSPDLLNAAELSEIYWLEKRDGFTTIHRAQDDAQLRALVDEGDQPGALWKQGLFGGVDP